MARGETVQTKVHYKGKDEDFIVIVDDDAEYTKWLEDKSVPLTRFVSTFTVFVTHKQGAQGMLDTASKSTLHNEFGTSSEDDVIKQILEKGNKQAVEMPERQGNKNDSMGAMSAH